MYIEVTGTDIYGNDAYKELFKGIISDSGTAGSIEKVKMSMDPSTPLFIISVIMKSKPESKRMIDAVSIRTEGKDVHLTITDENYAPQITSALWRMYGRDKVEQQTRFDVKIENGDEDRISETEIASGDDAKQEVIGAMWRILPEGIKARYNISEGRIITIAATEEIMTQPLKDKAQKMHNEVKDNLSAQEAEENV
ncbi:MAG: methanogenesis marker 17 protein [Methanomassiliicoccaceae archaeon]|nr:methanogenesis marker 17 protein [Methanomassiliicoccaceae archaeon]